MNMPNADVAIASSAPGGLMVPKAQSAAPARQNPPSRGRARKKPPPAIRIASGIPLAPPCRVTPAPLRRRPQNSNHLTQPPWLDVPLAEPPANQQTLTPTEVRR